MYKNMPCHKFVHFQNGVEKTEACGRCECCGCLWTLLVLLLCVWLKIIIISHPPHKIFHTSICQIFHKNNKMSSLCNGWKIVGLFRRNTFFCQNSFAARFFFQKGTKKHIMISSPGLRLRRKSHILEISGMGKKMSQNRLFKTGVCLSIEPFRSFLEPIMSFKS